MGIIERNQANFEKCKHLDIYLRTKSNLTVAISPYSVISHLRVLYQNGFDLGYPITIFHQTFYTKASTLFLALEELETKGILNWSPHSLKSLKVNNEVNYEHDFSSIKLIDSQNIITDIVLKNCTKCKLPYTESHPKRLLDKNICKRCKNE